jgi:hypothetical protein
MWLWILLFILICTLFISGHREPLDPIDGVLKKYSKKYKTTYNDYLRVIYGEGEIKPKLRDMGVEKLRQKFKKHRKYLLTGHQTELEAQTGRRLKKSMLNLTPYELDKQMRNGVEIFK